MAATFTYVPPTVQPGVAMHALVEAAETAGAQALLEASQPLVPKDTGALVESGHVEHDGHGAIVSYSAVNEADGYNYAAKQHEDETLNHPNGGQAHYLGDPMHTAQGAILAAVTVELRKS